MPTYPSASTVSPSTQTRSNAVPISAPPGDDDSEPAPHIAASSRHGRAKPSSKPAAAVARSIGSHAPNTPNISRRQSTSAPTPISPAAPSRASAGEPPRQRRPAPPAAAEAAHLHAARQASPRSWRSRCRAHQRAGRNSGMGSSCSLVIVHWSLVTCHWSLAANCWGPAFLSPAGTKVYISPAGTSDKGPLFTAVAASTLQRSRSPKRPPVTSAAWHESCLQIHVPLPLPGRGPCGWHAAQSEWHGDRSVWHPARS